MDVNQILNEIKHDRKYTLFTRYYNSNLRDELLSLIAENPSNWILLSNVLTVGIMSEVLHYISISEEEINRIIVNAYSNGKYDLVLKINDLIDPTSDNYISFTAKYDLNKLKNRSLLALDGKRDRVNFNLEDSFDPLELLENGFIPNLISLEDVDREISALNDNIPSDIYKYWWGRYPIDTLSEIKVWTLITYELAQKIALKGESAALIFSYPQMLYSSGRPVNDMGIFRTSFSINGIKIENDVIINDQPLSIINPSMEGSEILNGDCVIPVTRYTKGDKFSSLYFDDDINHERFCGVYYYYEPESTTYLLSKHTLVCETKADAAEYLLEIAPELREILDDYYDEYMNRVWVGRGINTDLKYTAREAERYLGFNTGQGNPRKLPDYDMYIGSHILYAKEDMFDQPICIAASEAGIDAIVFTRMVGRFKIITEVLNTKSKVESFNSLVFTK